MRALRIPRGVGTCMLHCGAHGVLVSKGEVLVAGPSPQIST